MKGQPWFKFEPVLFISDANVQVMTPEERGAYISLLCYDWIEDGLPADDDSLAVLSGARERWAVIKDRVLKCFIEKHGKAHGKTWQKIVNPKLEKERKRIAETWQKKADAGKKGANSRWANKKEIKITDSTCHTSAIVLPMAKNGNNRIKEEEEEEDKQTTIHHNARGSPEISPDLENAAMRVFGSVPLMQLTEWLEKYGQEWVYEALRRTESKGAGVPYCRGVLEGFTRDGGPENGKDRNGRGNGQTSGSGICGKSGAAKIADAYRGL